MDVFKPAQLSVMCVTLKCAPNNIPPPVKRYARKICQAFPKLVTMKSGTFGCDTQKNDFWSLGSSFTQQIYLCSRAWIIGIVTCSHINKQKQQSDEHLCPVT